MEDWWVVCEFMSIKVWGKTLADGTSLCVSFESGEWMASMQRPGRATIYLQKGYNSKQEAMQAIVQHASQ
jgi:hypothetical protein